MSKCIATSFRRLGAVEIKVVVPLEILAKTSGTSREFTIACESYSLQQTMREPTGSMVFLMYEKQKLPSDREPAVPRVRIRLAGPKCVMADTGTACSGTISQIGYDYCDGHLEEIGLDIHPSNIQGAGLGVFASRAIPRYTTRAGAENFVLEYRGRHAARSALDAIYGNMTAPYAIARGSPDGYCIDCAGKRSVASLVNHAPENAVRGPRANVVYSSRMDAKRGKYVIEVKALRDILPLEELYANYGNEYGFDDVHETVPYIGEQIPRAPKLLQLARATTKIRSPSWTGLGLFPPHDPHSLRNEAARDESANEKKVSG